MRAGGFKFLQPQEDLIRFYAFKDCVEDFGGEVSLEMDEYCLEVSARFRTQEEADKFRAGFDEAYQAALVVRTPKK